MHPPAAFCFIVFVSILNIYTLLPCSSKFREFFKVIQFLFIKNILTFAFVRKMYNYYLKAEY